MARASAITGDIGIVVGGVWIGAVTVIGAGVVMVLSAEHAD